MALGQHTAQLYEVVQHSPHLVLVHRAADGVLHLVFYSAWNGWATPCGIGLSQATLYSISYGKPTCFGCFLDDEDPSDVGRAGRNMIKLYYEQKGQHVHCVVFMGHEGETLANCGGVTLLTYEWREFCAALFLGAKQMGMRFALEEARR